jgi:sialidase-1
MSPSFLCIGLFISLILVVSGQVTFRTTLFNENTLGFQCYRTPALIRAPNKDLLVFVEARKGSSNVTQCSVTSPQKSIGFRKSTDNGKTWDTTKFLTDCKCGSGNECGYPSVVVDNTTSTIWLMYSGGAGTSVMKSSDNGDTWSTPEVLKGVSSFAKNPSVGHGIQLTPLCGQQHAGRLILPWVCGAHSETASLFHSCLVYSDDHGSTWNLGLSAQEGSRESELLQVDSCQPGKGQTLYMTERNFQGPIPYGHRLFAWSYDSGNSTSLEGVDPALIEPVTKDWTGVVASAIAFTANNNKQYILFSDPDSPDQRMNVSIRASSDLAKTWSKALVVDSGLSSYTDMVQIDQQTIGITLEEGKATPYDTIGYAIVDISTILN